MSERPQVNQRLSGPRHLVGGNARHRWEQINVAAAWSPLILAGVVFLVLAVALSPWVGLALVVALVSGAALVAGTDGVACWQGYAYWRSRWYYDARAAGLAVEAEPSVLAGTDGVLDRRRIVVPVLDLTVRRTGVREYRCRPLPGQTVADYEAAVERLLPRWGAERIAVAWSPGDRRVLLVVHPTAPAPTTYTRGA